MLHELKGYTNGEGSEWWNGQKTGRCDVIRLFYESEEEKRRSLINKDGGVEVVSSLSMGIGKELWRMGVQYLMFYAPHHTF